MKRLLLLPLLLATLPASGQAPKPTFRYDPQITPDHPRVFSLDMTKVPSLVPASCDVWITKASFERPARLMLASGASTQTRPSLSLELSNQSGKPIDFVELIARLKTKESVFDLDSVTTDVIVRLSGTDGPQREWLTNGALGLVDLTVHRVRYADGTIWEPKNDRACSYTHVPQSVLVLK
jgi:hypothetical protein